MKMKRSSIIITLAILMFACTGFSQTDKFKFEIDGELYLRIRKNAGGFNIIHQHNSQNSMFFGFNSGWLTIEDPMIVNSGTNNTAYGFHTLGTNTTGAQNTAIESGAMFDNESGWTNTAIGFGALHDGVTASLIRWCNSLVVQ